MQAGITSCKRAIRKVPHAPKGLPILPPSENMGGLIAKLYAAFYAKEMEVVLVGLENS